MKLLHTRNAASQNNAKKGLRAALKTAAAAIVSVATLGTMAIAGAGMASATENADPTLQPLAATKEVTPNGDGTYNLTLSVTGDTDTTEETTHTPADVVLVVDESTSMNEKGSWNQTRMQVAKTAATNLAGSLLTSANAGLDAAQQVQMSVVTFGHNIHKTQQFTTNSALISGAIANRAPENEATNWETALKAANDLSTNRANAKKYIILLSDGEPTLRDSSMGSWRPNDDGTYGSGSDDRGGNNYKAAVAEANKRGNATLFSVSAASGASGRMHDLVQDAGAVYYDGTDADKLAQAFADISQTITKSASYQNVVVNDALTKYVTFADIKDGAVQYTATEGTLEPVFDTAKGTITWDLSSLGTLPNDKTYTLTVKIKPTQVAYDEAVTKTKDNKTADFFSNESGSVSYTKVVTGQNPEDGTVNLTPGTVTVPVSVVTIKKEWKGDKNADQPKAVTVELDKNDAKYQDVTLTAENNWTADVVVPAGLGAYTWSVKEPTVADGYTAKVSDPLNFTAQTTNGETGTITVTNTYKAPTKPEEPSQPTKPTEPSKPTTKPTTKPAANKPAKTSMPTTGVAIAGIALAVVVIAAAGGVMLAIRRRNA